MDKETKKICFMFSRYVFIFLLGIGNLFLIYKIVTPITIFLVGKTVTLFGSIYSLGNLFYFSDFNVMLIPACVAGSAFFLLVFLVFSTANISPKKRILALLTSTAILLLLNYIRIILMISIANTLYFETVHWIFWNLTSVLFVVVIWFFVAKIYKINEVPIYSDIKYLISLRNKKPSKHKNKIRKK